MNTENPFLQPAAVLRLHGNRLGALRDTIEFLKDFESAYSNLAVFWSLYSGIREGFGAYTFDRKTPPFRLISEAQVPTFLLPEERPRLKAVSFSSPGFWDFLGSLNILETLRKWANDGHERRKDREYREGAERTRLTLENRARELELLQDEIQLLRQAGVPDQKLRQALNRYVVDPLARLEVHQDRGLLETANLLEDGNDGDAPI